MVIESRSNPIVKAARTLSSAKARKETGTHLIEGEKLVLEALSSGAQITDLFVEAGKAFPTPEGVRLHWVTPMVLECICQLKSVQGVAAVANTPDTTMPDEFPTGLILVLDGVQDPGNVGAILRSADAFGAAGVLLSPDCADPYNPKTLRAAMGSTYHLPLWQGDAVVGLDRMHEQGFAAVCGHLQGSGTLPQCSDKLALVIGSEGAGVSPEVAKRCILYRLPMRGRAESLNASVAAGILMYQVSETFFGGTGQ